MSFQWATCFLSHNGCIVPTSLFHIIPVNDTIDHSLEPDCECGPRVQPYRGEGNLVLTYGYLHRAADGRKE